MHVHLADWIGLPSLPTGATSSQGGPPPESVTHLVDGTPEEEWLDLPHLEAVIVPWAGIPTALASQIKSRPHLQLYNLHVNAQAVAELTLGLILASARGIHSGDACLRRGDWHIPEASYPNVKLKGLTACLVGAGAIGTALEPMLHGLGMKTLRVRRRPGPGERSLDGLVEAAAQSHLMLISLPLSPQTEGAVGFEALMALQPPRIVVNVGRGPLIREEDLYRFLKEGHGWAGLDVWYSYPSERREGSTTHFPSSLPFHELPNVVMSPHRGGWTNLAEEERTEGVAQLLADLFEGRPVPVVDPEVG
jgi:phosphoglycerate dehydrogenase-like enzyme